jgi:hypothetical protein
MCNSEHNRFAVHSKFIVRSIRTLPTVAIGRAKAVGFRLFTAEARVRGQVNPCGIYFGQTGTGTGFFSESFCFPLSVSFYRCSIFSHVSSGGWTMGPLAAPFDTDSLTPSQIITMSVAIMPLLALMWFRIVVAQQCFPRTISDVIVAQQWVPTMGVESYRRTDVASP